MTRVTKLPFLVDEKHLAFQVRKLIIFAATFKIFHPQTHVVTTTVIPSEPGEAGIPWWVWILAALGGILVLAVITYCLYKVTILAKLLTSCNHRIYSADSSNVGDLRTGRRPSL